MIPTGATSYPTAKLCSGWLNDTRIHVWYDETERERTLHQKPSFMQECPDHDGLPNAESVDHLAHQ